MNTPLNNDTQQKARDLARKITVAHDLDPEIQEELYGHIEDKLLAYKSGEERISDEDAFILVREHFGDAKVIRGLLQEVHAGAIQMNLLRRVLALLIATAALQSVFTVIRGLLVTLLGVSGAINERVDQAIFAVMLFSMLAGLLHVLHRWRKAEHAGRMPWYGRYPLSRMFKLLCMAIALTWVLPTVTLSQEGLWSSEAQLSGAYALIVISAALLSSCLIWLWWTDAAGRTLAGNVGLGLMWVFFWFARSIYPAKVFVVLGGYEPVAGQPTLTQGRLGTIPVTALLAHGGHWESQADINASLFAAAWLALYACIAAACWHHFRRWQQSHSNNSIAQS